MLYLFRSMDLVQSIVAGALRRVHGMGTVLHDNIALYFPCSACIYEPYIYGVNMMVWEYLEGSYYNIIII